MLCFSGYILRVFLTCYVVNKSLVASFINKEIDFQSVNNIASEFFLCDEIIKMML